MMWPLCIYTKPMYIYNRKVVSWRLINAYPHIVSYLFSFLCFFLLFLWANIHFYSCFLFGRVFVYLQTDVFVRSLTRGETKIKDRPKEKGQRSLWSGGGECVKLLFIIIIIIISCGSLQQYKTTTWKGSFEKWWWLYIISSFHAHSNKLFIIKHLHHFSSNNAYIKYMKTRFRTYLR